MGAETIFIERFNPPAISSMAYLPCCDEWGDCREMEECPICGLDLADEECWGPELRLVKAVFKFDRLELEGKSAGFHQAPWTMDEALKVLTSQTESKEPHIEVPAGLFIKPPERCSSIKPGTMEQQCAWEKGHKGPHGTGGPGWEDEEKEDDGNELSKMALPPSELLEIVERLKSITSIRDEEKDLGYELEIRSLWARLKSGLVIVPSGGPSQELIDMVNGYEDSIKHLKARIEELEGGDEPAERKAYVFYDSGGEPSEYVVTDQDLADYELGRLNEMFEAADNAECVVKLEEVE